MLFEDSDGIFFPLGCKRWCSFKRIGNAKFLVFVGTHGVKGEYLYFFDDAMVSGNVLGKCIEVLIAVSKFWYNDMTNPRGFLNLLQVVEHLLVGCSRVAGELLVEGVVDGFDVEQDEVGVLQRLLDCVVEDGAAGVDGCVETFLFAELEKLSEEGSLHERLSACASDPSLTNEVFIAFNFINEFFRCHLVGHFSLWIPCIRIVAEGTSHGTALEKGYKPNSRAIYCTKGFYAMNTSFQFAIINDYND